MNKLYSKEQIEEWASKRADDAGRLSRQLLDTIQENERLRAALKHYTYEDCVGKKIWNAGRIARKALRNKESM